MKLRYDVRRRGQQAQGLLPAQAPLPDRRGPICVDKTEGLAKSPDYPSGHTTWGWTVGLVLAEADPAHATAILSRARAFGESRLVCGVHNASAIEAGRTNAAALVAALHGSKAFRDDLDAVRDEIAELRKSATARPSAMSRPR
jgi:acid phosphatase (class A)